jgi:hypothetical protein
MFNPITSFNHKKPQSVIQEKVRAMNIDYSKFVDPDYSIIDQEELPSLVIKRGEGYIDKYKNLRAEELWREKNSILLKELFPDKHILIRGQQVVAYSNNEKKTLKWIDENIKPGEYWCHFHYTGKERIPTID